MKKANFEKLIVGKEYYVHCGIYKAIVTYVGSQLVGKRMKYRFTFGQVDNWKNQFNFFSTKSNLKVFELIEN